LASSCFKASDHTALPSIGSVPHGPSMERTIPNSAHGLKCGKLFRPACFGRCAGDASALCGGETLRSRFRALQTPARRFEGGRLASPTVSSVSLMAMSNTWFASWTGSRGRLATNRISHSATPSILPLVGQIACASRSGKQIHRSFAPRRMTNYDAYLRPRPPPPPEWPPP
jgi:hypothetical protein